MTTSAITTSRLRVEYRTPAGPIVALDHGGLDVETGTSLALMGASGCGKSTLLGLLAGLGVPTDGTVTVGGVVVSELTERERVEFGASLGMVYQADNLLPFLTVEENVALPLSIGGVESGDPQDLLDTLGLAGLAGRFPDQLSGGQRQRVAVARAIVHRPSVILADEPTGALDADAAATVIGTLVDAHRAVGATLVLVTHDPVIAASADRVEQLRRPTPETPT